MFSRMPDLVRRRVVATLVMARVMAGRIMNLIPPGAKILKFTPSTSTVPPLPEAGSLPRVTANM